MPVLSIRAQIKPANQKEFMQTLRSLVQHSAREEGCLSSRFYRDTEAENTFLLVEEWTSPADLDAYFQSDRFGVLLGGMRFLLSEKPQIRIYSISDEFDNEADLLASFAEQISDS
jgi:quinol monooxygenase YgiN